MKIASCSPDNDPFNKNIANVVNEFSVDKLKKTTSPNLVTRILSGVNESRLQSYKNTELIAAAEAQSDFIITIGKQNIDNGKRAGLLQLEEALNKHIRQAAISSNSAYRNDVMQARQAYLDEVKKIESLDWPESEKKAVVDDFSEDMVDLLNNLKKYRTDFSQ